MPRDKRGGSTTPRGKSHRSSRGGGRGGRGSNLNTSFLPFAGGHRELSLQEEARNTERHTFSDSDQKLRYARVNFVSASTTAKTDDDTAEANKSPDMTLADMSLESPPEEPLEFEVVVEVEHPVAAKGTPLEGSSPKLDALGFIIDIQGDQTVHTGLPTPRLRSASPAPSNSSEEVILFSGRNNRGKPRIAPPARTVTDPIDRKIRIIEEKIQEKKELLNETINEAESVDPSSTDFEALLPRRGKRNRRQDHTRKTVKQEEEEALIADYILNIDGGDDDLMENVSFSQRELGGMEEESWHDETAVSPGKVSKHQVEGGWDRSDICDFDDMSTSDGVMGEVQAIFSKRERDTGLQYLVVWQDQTIDEARWVPASTLASLGALSCIESFEAEERLVAEFQDYTDGESTDSGEVGLDDEEDEDDEDEQDLVQRKVDRMTDERIARLLAKQEELGMGSSELLLFDDAADTDEDEAAVAPQNTFSPLILPASQPRARESKSKRHRGEFPAAIAMADAYDGFDIMDFERPSLRKKPKGRKGKLAFDLSDSELEASAQMAWDNDRIKKKERKQEREELRSQGLLGTKNVKPDLKQKYKEGMGFQGVKEEIKNFLMGGNTTLALPPMDKADRKVVHEIANAFNLKSKSAGKGNGRFPVLYRTSRTSVYIEQTFAAVEARLTRRFLPRMDVRGKKATPNRSGRAGGGGGFNSTAVSYRDGDIVGGSAPELGIDNKGRAMLEKMGWSTGTALGALNNKGMLQPVSHIVKTTKAGLG